MKVPLLPVAAALLIASAMPALAVQCGSTRGNFSLTSAGPWPLATSARSGEECQGIFRAGSRTVFKRLYVVSPPRNGSVRLQQGGYYHYRSQPGFRGTDTFSLRICGDTGGVEGCADLAVQMFVN
jgi:hypothetical protein